MGTDNPPADPLRRATDASVVLAGIRATEAAIARSRLSSGITRFGHTARRSYLYRWLTSEPEPEVIVIDLRDTVTVGPIVARLDRLVDLLAPYWATSNLKTFTDGVVRVLDHAAQTRLGRALVQLLEPPEPPDERDDQ